MKDNAEDLLVLTLGGERSPDVYAFSPQSLQETKVPNANIARKAGGAIFFNDILSSIDLQSASLPFISIITVDIMSSY